MRLYIAILLAALLALAGVLLGIWWAPFVVGVLLGALDSRARIMIPAATAAGLLAWAIPIAVLGLRYGLSPSAQALAAIMGFDHLAALPVVLTLLVGTLLGASGGWLGSATRAVVARSARVDATRNG